MLPFNSLMTFLSWLVGPGLPVVVGGTLSVVAWNIPAWEKLPTLVKSLAPMVLAVLYSYLGNFLINTPDIVYNHDVNFIFNTALFYYASQAQYGRLKREEIAQDYTKAVSKSLEQEVNSNGKVKPAK